MMKALLRWLRASTAIRLYFRWKTASRARRRAEVAYSRACADYAEMPALTVDNWRGVLPARGALLERRTSAGRELHARIDLEEIHAHDYLRHSGELS